jgi:Na+-driven multidrug efflux pump
MVFPAQLLSLFSASADMLEIGVPALRIISVTFALSSITMILGYSMSGMGNGVINMLGTALRQLIIFVPIAFLFAKYLGIDKVWYSMWISEVVAVIYAIVASYREVMKIEKAFW